MKRKSPSQLLDWQREVWESDARFKCVAVGRRAGKTFLAGMDALDVAARQQGNVWWVSPNHTITSSVAWPQLIEFARMLNRVSQSNKGPLVAEVIKSVYRVNFAGGGFVECKSAHEFDKLVGVGLDLVIFDEAARIDPRAWNDSIYPALTDRNGRALFISSPMGKRNWFYKDLFLRGLSDEHPDWQSWQLPSSVNPLMTESIMSEHRLNTTEADYRQNFLAEFIEDSHRSVFNLSIDRHVTAEHHSNPKPGHEYIFSCDWGQKHDYTVICVLDVTNNERVELVKLKRFRKMEYPKQRAILTELYKQFMPSVIIAEANAMGLPIAQELQADNMPVELITVGSNNKTNIIKSLVLALESGTLSIIPDDNLISELRHYEMKYNQNGNPVYSAPAGQHDDCVMSLALGINSMHRHIIRPELSQLPDNVNIRNLIGI